MISRRSPQRTRPARVNTSAVFGIIRFDKYPFVFLNLFMSAEAAFAAAERDRVHAQHDYDVNVATKAENEGLITTLARIENDKLDKIIAALNI